MNYIKLLFGILIVYLINLTSCNSCTQQVNEGSESEKGEGLQNVDSALSKWDYENDSGEIAVVYFDTDGNMQYVVDKPDNIFIPLCKGLDYKIVDKYSRNRKANVGDVLYLDISYKTELSDSILFTSKDLNEEFKLRINTPSNELSIERVLLLLHENDSAVIKIDAANFYINTLEQASIPAFIKTDEQLIFNLRVNKIQTSAEYILANKSSYESRITEENSLIERFLLDKKYPIKRTDSGLTILTIGKGAGIKPKPGNTVKIDYTAAFIDGGVFDSTLERSEPFSFVVGNKQVIRGLEEAVTNMNVGDHCLVIIPFRLAYGDQKYGNIIPPFSTLVFEIELIDAK